MLLLNYISYWLSFKLLKHVLLICNINHINYLTFKFYFMNIVTESLLNVILVKTKLINEINSLIRKLCGSIIPT